MSSAEPHFPPALVALVFSKSAAFIGGTMVLLILQVSAALFRAGFGEVSLWRRIYEFLPPVGEIFFDLKNGMVWDPTGQHLVLLTVWLAILMVLFRLRLNRA